MVSEAVEGAPAQLDEHAQDVRRQDRSSAGRAPVAGATIRPPVAGATMVCRSTCYHCITSLIVTVLLAVLGDGRKSIAFLLMWVPVICPCLMASLLTCLVVVGSRGRRQRLSVKWLLKAFKTTPMTTMS